MLHGRIAGADEKKVKDRTAAESKLAEVTAERNFSRAECEELRLRLSMQQQSDSPAFRPQQDQGHRGRERQPQPPSTYARFQALLPQKLTQVGWFISCISQIAARVCICVCVCMYACMCALLTALSWCLAPTRGPNDARNSSATMRIHGNSLSESLHGVPGADTATTSTAVRAVQRQLTISKPCACNTSSSHRMLSC